MAVNSEAEPLVPECRLACLALVSTSLFLSRGPAVIVTAVASLRLLAAAGAGIGRILRESSFVAGMFVFAALLQGVSLRGGLRLDPALLADAAAYCARLFAAFLAGKVFYFSTRGSELRDAATRLARLLPAGTRGDAGLALSLVLGFIPAIEVEWKESLLAARSRGLPRRPGLKAWAAVLGAFMRRLMLRAAATPQALAARAWRGDRRVEGRPWGPRETIAVAACAAVLAASAAGLA